MSVTVLPYGDRALLAETDSGPDAVLELADFAAAQAGVATVVPAARTVLIRVTDGIDGAGIESLAERLATFETGISQAGPASPHARPMGVEHVIGVHYRGPDLDAVGDMVGLSREAVVALHASGRYRVAFCGFAPGFAYLTGLPTRLHVPRRASPRTQVPAGAVAIASEYSAVYPRASPGGWQLLGETSQVLWDVEHSPPARLAPGDHVRFRDMDAR